VRIAYVQYTNPAAYPPLEHSSRILARDGWQVLFLGTSSQGARSLRFPPHSNVTVRCFGTCSLGFRQKLHYLTYCMWVLAWVLAWRPRWVYASDPLSCPIALVLSWIPGVKVVYHEHDSPSGPLVTIGIRWLVLQSRIQLAKSASCCILPNERRIEKFESDTNTGCAPMCVWNCPSLDEISEARPPLTGPDVWVLYHGSIVPERLPLDVLVALSALPDSVKLRIVGYETSGSNGYVRALQEKARDLEISHRLEWVGTVPTRSQLLRYGRISDIGVALMPLDSDDINMAAMAGASNKPFDYLACGLALIVSNLPDWRTTFVEPGYALTCAPEDPVSIAQTLRWLVDHPAEMRAMGERGRQRILREWNYETQFAAVYQALTAEWDGSAVQTTSDATR
jgi:glycosyltransferase involved in cell wall biosynthesis